MRSQSSFYCSTIFLCTTALFGSGVLFAQEEPDQEDVDLGLDLDVPFPNPGERDPQKYLMALARIFRLPTPPDLPSGLIAGVPAHEVRALPSLSRTSYVGWDSSEPGRVTWSLVFPGNGGQNSGDINVRVMLSLFLSDKVQFENEGAVFSPAEAAYGKAIWNIYDAGSFTGPVETYLKLGIESLGHASLFHRFQGNVHRLSFSRNNLCAYFDIGPLQAASVDILQIAREFDALIMQQPIYNRAAEMETLKPIVGIRPLKDTLHQGESTTFIVTYTGSDALDEVRDSAWVYVGTRQGVLAEIFEQEHPPTTYPARSVFGFSTDQNTPLGKHTFYVEGIPNARGLWAQGVTTTITVLPARGKQDDDHDDRRRGDEDHPGQGHDNSPPPGRDRKQE